MKDRHPMNDDTITHLREALATPRRDWKFWGAIAAALLVGTVALSTVALIGDRNQWRDRFDQQTTEQLCRSAANAGVNAANADLAGAHARLTVSVDRGLAASARGDVDALTLTLEELDHNGDVVEAAIVNLDLAIAAQKLALEVCQPPEDDPPATETITPTTEEE